MILSEGRSATIVESPDGISWRPESRACPVCESRDSRTLGLRGGEAHREGKGIRAVVVKCKNCTAIYTNPTLIPQSNPYSQHTPDQYFHAHETQTKVNNGVGVVAFAESIIGGAGSMLELGCGRGELLHVAARCGWSVAGVEMTEAYADLARDEGLEVESSPVESCKLLDRTYDVIILAAILEHLYEPIAVLKKVREALRPGGLVFIDVPNECSLTMKMGNFYLKARGLEWVMNLSPTFPPYHVVGFSKRSLEYALRVCGFRVHTLGLPKWDNSLPKHGGVRQVVERFGFSVVQHLGSYIGMGDGIYCWAVREG